MLRAIVDDAVLEGRVGLGVVEVFKLLLKGFLLSIDGLPILVVILHLNIFGMDLAVEAFGVFLPDLSVLLATLVLEALLVEYRGILVLPVEVEVALHIVEGWVRRFYESRCTSCASAGRCRSYLGRSPSTIFIYPL